MTLRSITAVAAGAFLAIVLIILLFMALGIFAPAAYPQLDVLPSIPWAIVILLYGLGASTVGSAVTVLISRGSRLRHVHSLAIVMLFIGLVSLATNVRSQPMWFLLLQVVVLVAGAYVGGHLANKRFPQTPPMLQ